MGLDIFLYRLTKPELDTSKTYTDYELYDNGYSFIQVEDNEHKQIYSQDIIDKFATIVNVQTWYDDNVAFFKEFQKKYPEIYLDINDYFSDIENKIRKVKNNHPYFDPRVFVQGPISESVKLKIIDIGPLYTNSDIDYLELNNITITIDLETENNKFTITKGKPTYVFKVTELDYQGKGLNDHGWELLPKKSTHCTNKSIIEQLVEKGNLSESFLENWVDGETALVAWQ